MGFKKAEPTEIVPMDNSNMNVIDVEAAVSQWETYQEVTGRILDESDYVEINGKKFKKKSAWRKYKRAFNISTKILEKNITRFENGRAKEAEFVVRASLPDGTYADGYGNCHISERDSWSKPNHDMPATAQTRATNRAISDLIGAGEVSSEEMENAVEEKPKKKSKSKAAIDVAPKDVEVIK